MTPQHEILRGIRPLIRAYSAVVKILVFGLLFFSGLGIVTMIVVICLDVVLRLFGSPLIGAFDIVKIAGTITIACALPYTTAVKGHVAIEYFFHKLNRTGRILVDSIARSISIALFSLLAWETVKYGRAMKHSGQVSTTLQLPIHWVPYVIALSCAVVVLVIIHNLLHPGKEMIKP